MRYRKEITVLVIIIAVTSFAAAVLGICSEGGPGASRYKTVRGAEVELYGQGLYRHMTSDVAIQGIAQDYVTLFGGIPLLLFALYETRKGKLYAKFLLTGTLLYFFLTYLFYTAMAMYNEMFLAYVVLLCCALFGLVLNLVSFNYRSSLYASDKNLRVAAYFLLINCLLIALLWLSVIVPPLADGSVYPADVAHYTTLIVQGFDLGIFLPLGAVSAVMALKRSHAGRIFTTVYVVFLTLLMTALTAKVLFMAHADVNVIPAVFIMPTIGGIAGILSFSLLRQLHSAPEIQPG